MLEIIMTWGTVMIRVAGSVAALGAVLFCLTASAQDAPVPATPTPAAITNFKPVTDAMLANPDPADWPMWRRTLNNWGYSPLEQVTRPLAAGDQEGTPLVYGGLMYFPNPGDVTQAFDAKTGEFIWEYRRSMPSD